MSKRQNNYLEINYTPIYTNFMSITQFNTDCTLDDLISRPNDVIAESAKATKEVFVATSGKKFMLWAAEADIAHLFQGDLVNEDEKDSLTAAIKGIIAESTGVEYPPKQTGHPGPCCALLSTPEAMTAKQVYDAVFPLVGSAAVPSFKLHHVDLIGVKEVN